MVDINPSDLSMSLHSFFGKESTYILDGKGVPSCQYPIGATETGECTIQDTYDCANKFVGTHVVLTYQRNENEIINTNLFFSPDGQVSSLSSNGSLKQGTFQIYPPTGGDGSQLIMDTYGYSQYLGRNVHLITNIVKNSQGYTCEKIIDSDGTMSRVPYYTCNLVRQ